jgi:hypothetical protein
MENSPHQENVPQKLETGIDAMLEMNRQQVIESIEKNGVEASMELIGKWCDKAEKWAEEDPMNRTQVTRRMVIINFAKYDFYISAKDTDGALECANDALFMAEQEGYFDLKKKIEKRISEAIPKSEE